MGHTHRSPFFIADEQGGIQRKRGHLPRFMLYGMRWLLCFTSDVSKHAGKDKLVKWVERVPVCKTEESYWVKNGRLADHARSCLISHFEF